MRLASAVAVALIALTACSNPHQSLPDPARSTASLDRNANVIADGRDHVTVSIFLQSATGAPVAGQPVTLSVVDNASDGGTLDAGAGDGGSPDIIVQPLATDITGHAEGTVASKLAGDKTIVVSLLNGVLSPSPPLAVHFVPIPETKLAFAVPPSAAQAGSTLAPAVQVNVEDATGLLIGNATDTITLTLSAGPPRWRPMAASRCSAISTSRRRARGTR